MPVTPLGAMTPMHTPDPNGSILPVSEVGDQARGGDYHAPEQNCFEHEIVVCHCLGLEGAEHPGSVMLS